MNRKTQANFIKTEPHKRHYSAVDAMDVFQWRAPALDLEEDYIRDCKTWDKNLAAGIKQWKEYVNNGEYLFLTIQGQVEPSFWDKTKDNARSAAIQTLKYPITLINLMKKRSTGTMDGIREPLAHVTQLQKTVQQLQNPVRGDSTPTGDFKLEVESYVETTCRLGRFFSFGTTLMESFLTDAGETLATYLAMDVAH